MGVIKQTALLMIAWSARVYFMFDIVYKGDRKFVCFLSHFNVFRAGNV